MSSKFLFLAGNLCLDFLNTEIILNGERTDLLESGADFFLWLQDAQIFERDILENMKANWWNIIFPEAIEFRQALRKMIESIENQQVLAENAIEAINHYLLSVPTYQQIELEGAEFHTHFHYRITEAEQLLYPIAESARELLTECEHSRIKQCASDTCILHFYDSSKNGSRRWCSMETCGNRSKVKRHYERAQGE